MKILPHYYLWYWKIKDHMNYLKVFAYLWLNDYYTRIDTGEKSLQNWFSLLNIKEEWWNTKYEKGISFIKKWIKYLANDEKIFYYENWKEISSNDYINKNGLFDQFKVFALISLWFFKRNKESKDSFVISKKLEDFFQNGWYQNDLFKSEEIKNIILNSFIFNRIKILLSLSKEDIQNDLGIDLSPDDADELMEENFDICNIKTFRKYFWYYHSATWKNFGNRVAYIESYLKELWFINENGRIKKSELLEALEDNKNIEVINLEMTEKQISFLENSILYSILDYFLKKDDNINIIWLFGKWWRWKTYLINNYIRKKEEKKEKILFFEHNAWEYQNQLWWMSSLYLTILNKYYELIEENYKWKIKIYKILIANFNINKERIWYWPLIILILLIIISIIISILIWKVNVIIWLNSLFWVSLVLWWVFQYLFNKDLYINTYNKYLKIFDYKKYLWWKYDIKENIKYLFGAINKIWDFNSKILVIDDLDRCNLDNIMSVIDWLLFLLEKIKMNNLKVIINIDERLLKKALIYKYSLKDNLEDRKFIKDYLDKIFNIWVKLVDLSNEDKGYLISNNNDNNNENNREYKEIENSITEIDKDILKKALFNKVITPREILILKEKIIILKYILKSHFWNENNYEYIIEKLIKYYNWYEDLQNDFTKYNEEYIKNSLKEEEYLEMNILKLIQMVLIY